MKWYYTDGNKNVGPLSDDAMKEMRTAGVIQADTWVRMADSEDWIAFDKAFRPQPDVPISVAPAHSASSTAAHGADASPKSMGLLPLILLDEDPSISLSVSPHQPPEDPNSPEVRRRRKKARKRREVIISAVVGLAIIAGGGGALFYFSGGKFSGRVNVSKQEILKQTDSTSANLETRAESGDSRAQADLGFEFWQGSSRPKDITEAIKWLRKSADQGDCIGQYILGAIYNEGRDYAEALKWYLKAANQDAVPAQGMVGIYYAKGLGVEQDLAEATRWLSKGAIRGSPIDQFHLGLCYLASGDRNQLVNAYIWFNLAAASNDESVAKKAAGRREDVAREMTSQQIAEAQNYCRNWKPQE